jgi:thioredoxin 1
VAFYKVDVDKNSDATSKAGINCMPTIVFYKDGEEVKRIEGADEDGVKAAVEEFK